MPNKVIIQAIDTQGYPINNLKKAIKLYINSQNDDAPKIDCAEEKENGIYVFDVNDCIDTLSRIFVRLIHDIDIIKDKNKITYLKEPHFLHPTCVQINILECMLNTSKVIPYTFVTAKGKAFIGIIKAYKSNNLNKCSYHYKSYSDTFDNTLMSYKDDWQNEIYTIDTNQTIRLQAFISKSSTNKALNENLQNVSLSQIKWGYKIISSTLKTNINEYNKINKEKDIIKLDNKIGTNIWLNLDEIKQNFKANEHIFDNSGNNIIIFAYTQDMDKHIYNLGYRQLSQLGRVNTIQCIELKIIKNRFHLRYDNYTLELLENERVVISLQHTQKLFNFLCEYTNTQNFKENYAYKMQITQKERFIHDFKAITPNDKSDIINYLDTDSLYLEFIENKEITIEIIRQYEDIHLTMSNFRILINGNKNPKCQEHININNDKIVGSCQSCQKLQALAKFDNHYFLERSGPDCITPDLELRIPEGRYSVSWHKSNKYLDPKGDEYNNILQIYLDELGIKHESHKKRYWKPLLNLHNRYLHKDRHILIHSGGKIHDSQGCLLIGERIDVDDKGNPTRIAREHTHNIASDFMAFLMQKDTKKDIDSNTSKFRHLLTKDEKVEIPNMNIIIRNKFGNIEKSKKIVAIDKDST